MDVELLSDKILGAIANLIQVAAGMAAFFVFVLPRRVQQCICERVVLVAGRVAQSSWLSWLKRASLRTHRLLARLYGPARRGEGTGARRHLTMTGFRTSAEIASIYLILGCPTWLVWSLLSGRSALQRMSAILMGVTVAVCIALAVWLAWKFRTRSRSSSLAGSDPIGALIRCALLTVFVPFMVAGMLGYDGEGGSQATMDAPVMLFLLIVFICGFYLGVRELVRAFGIYLPLGTAAFIGVSAPVCALALTIGGKTGRMMLGQGIEFGAWHWVSLMALLLLLLRSLPRLSIRYRWSANAAGFMGLVLALLETAASAARDPSAWLQPKAEGLPSLVSMFFMLGAVVAFITSLIYVNALCDWFSVAVTRRLLVSIARSGTLARYVRYMALDALLAAVLLLLAYALFVVLMHLYVLVLSYPLEDFLRGLRSLDTIMGVMISGQSAPASGPSGAIGVELGRFVFVFGLSALVPTFVHLLLLAAWGGGRIFYYLASVPAKTFLEKWQANDENDQPFGVRAGVIYALTFIALAALWGGARALEVWLEPAKRDRPAAAAAN